MTYLFISGSELANLTPQSTLFPFPLIAARLISSYFVGWRDNTWNYSRCPSFLSCAWTRSQSPRPHSANALHLLVDKCPKTKPTQTECTAVPGNKIGTLVLTVLGCRDAVSLDSSAGEAACLAALQMLHPHWGQVTALWSPRQK